jgi:hypothetical protein
MNMHSQTVSRKAIKTAILAIIVTSLSSASYAQSVAKTDSSGKEISVQYLGSENDMMLVAVKYNNVTDSKFVLSIYNEDGDVVFRNSYHSKDFDKKFKIPKDHGKVNFVFSGMQDKLSRSYTIHNTSRLIEDVVVTKIN